MNWPSRLAEVQAIRLAYYDQREALLREALRTHLWNLHAAANALGVNRSTLRRWLERHHELEADYGRMRRWRRKSG